MSDVKTVDSSLRTISDPLLRKQKEDVAKMRASLLSCSDDLSNTAVAMRNITVLRVYHQVSRIVRYIELMDKIEAKLYDSIDVLVDNIDETNPTAWMTLLGIQTKLQESMIKSHKLLEPYLNIQDMAVMDIPASSTISDVSISGTLLSKDSRDRIRNSAQQVLSALSSGVIDIEAETNE